MPVCSELESSPHARKRIEEQDLNIGEVKMTVKHPHELLFDVVEKHYIAVNNDLQLIVAFDLEGSKYIIVTAYYSSSARKREGGLRWSFNREHDIFGVIVKSGKAITEELAEDIWVEFDEKGNIVGVEILDASKVLGEYWKDPEGAALRALEITKHLAAYREVMVR